MSASNADLKRASSGEPGQQGGKRACFVDMTPCRPTGTPEKMGDAHEALKKYAGETHLPSCSPEQEAINNMNEGEKLADRTDDLPCIPVKKDQSQSGSKPEKQDDAQDAVDEQPSVPEKPKQSSQLEEGSLSDSQPLKRAYFDLETCDLDHKSGILQIAACTDTDSFSIYVRPIGPIHPEASRVHGLTYKEELLLLSGQPVDCVPIEQALDSFFCWLSKQGKCILIAHKAAFDKQHLQHNIRVFAPNPEMVCEFDRIINGYVDTLPLFQHCYPCCYNHRLVTLVRTILKDNSFLSKAHNAVQDALALKKLVTLSSVSDEELLQYKIY